MSRWHRAFPVLVVALLVVAACSVCLAQAADAGVHLCDAAKGWGPAKSETGQSTSLLLELAAMPGGSIRLAPALSAWADPPDWLALVVDRRPAQPRASRAPPLT
ncbi:MAG TPA: hypothetical protein VFV05_06395 [Methylomirabilota bacterium]|nr:hypothetical protein [Methylomirabilota bacterium]